MKHEWNVQKCKITLIAKEIFYFIFFLVSPKKERSDFCVFSLSTHKCVDICESGYCKYFKRILDIFHFIHVKKMFYFYWYRIYSHSFTIVEICLTFHSIFCDSIKSTFFIMNQRLLNLSNRWEKLWIIEFMGNIFNWPWGIFFIRFFCLFFDEWKLIIQIFVGILIIMGLVWKLVRKML